MARVGASRGPARLCLRFGDSDLPGSLGEGEDLGIGQLQQYVADAIHWRGVLPVWLWAMEAGSDPRISEMARFSHRLEAPTSIVSSGQGIDKKIAVEWLATGARIIQFWMGGLSADVHSSVLDSEIDDLCKAVRTMVQERDRGEFNTQIEVVLWWKGRANEEAQAVWDWAMEIGVDGFRIAAPYYAANVAQTDGDLDFFAELLHPKHRSEDEIFATLRRMSKATDSEPGERRGFSSCPVGGMRMEISAKGRLCCCPFQVPLSWNRGNIEELYSGSDHLSAIKACGRKCSHPLLGNHSIGLERKST
jgi:hypothetical protein